MLELLSTPACIWLVGITLTDVWCLYISQAKHANASIVLLLQTLLHTFLLGDISHFFSLGFDDLYLHVIRLNPESLHVSDWQVNTSKHAFSRHFLRCFQHEILLDKTDRYSKKTVLTLQLRMP